MNGIRNLSTGNAVVDRMASFNITGNIIPMKWFNTIRYPNGKPHLTAIAILSDIVYWHRPREIRDECTGQIIGYEKRFQEDMLQRNYQQISELFGISKKQATAAIDFLQKLGVIRKEFRNITRKGLYLNNVLYIELNPERLYELTYPEECQCLSVSPLKGIPLSLQGERVSTSKGTPIPFEGETNTEIITKTTNRDYINPILSVNDDETVTLEQLKEQLDYEAICVDYPYDREKIDGLINIIHDILFMDDSEKVSVNRQRIPAYKVKQRFMNLNMFDIQYVLSSLANTENKITNMRSYLITSLYNAPDTRETYMANWVQSDQARILSQKQQEINNNSKTTYGEMTIEELEQLLISNNANEGERKDG